MKRKPARICPVESWLLAGPQPRKKQAAALRAAAVDTIVNLRRRDRAARFEKCAPHVLSVHIPVRSGRAPTIAQAVKWLRFLDDVHGRRTIYVYDSRGKGSVLVFCALVRIAQGWDIDRVIHEHRRFGRRKRAHRRRIKFLRTFYEAVASGRIGIPRL